MSKCVDMGSGVHCAPTGVLYIDGRPYEMVGDPRPYTFASWAVSPSAVLFTPGDAG